METKRPFARVAGWAALALALAAMVLFLISVLSNPLQAAMPAAFAMTLVTILALGVFACVLGAILCGGIALLGMKAHGRKGILGPAASGLTLGGLMLIPILMGMSSGFSEHSRLVNAREVAPAKPTQTNSPATPVPPVPAK